MKTNAPEKIYMPTELLSEEWTRHIEGQDVEYTRTDAFIEKGCDWLKSKGGFTIGFSGAEIKDFKNYMLNESR